MGGTTPTKGALVWNPELEDVGDPRVDLPLLLLLRPPLGLELRGEFPRDEPPKDEPPKEEPKPDMVLEPKPMVSFPELLTEGPDVLEPELPDTAYMPPEAWTAPRSESGLPKSPSGWTWAWP